MAIISKPQIKKNLEIPYHSNDAPGIRYTFMEKEVYSKSVFYIAGRKVENIPQNKIEYIENHRHNCNSFYLFIGNNVDLTGLNARVHIENKKFMIKSPSAIMIPKFNLHSFKLTKGSGWFFHINLNGDYHESLDSDLEIDMSNILVSNTENVYKNAKKQENCGMLNSNIDKNSNPQKWAFVNQILFQYPGIYVILQQIFSDKSYNYQMQFHHHNADEVYLILGTNGKKLEIDFIYGNERIKVQSPAVIYNQSNINHKYEYIRGEGLILVILKEDVSD